MTQRYFRFLFWCRERNKEDWAKGQFEGKDMNEWALRNAKVLGGVAAIDDLLSLEMQDIIDGEKEAHEHIRNESSRLDSNR